MTRTAEGWGRDELDERGTWDVPAATWQLWYRVPRSDPGAWDPAGTYLSWSAAQRAADWWRAQGYDTDISFAR